MTSIVDNKLNVEALQQKFKNKATKLEACTEFAKHAELKVNEPALFSLLADLVKLAADKSGDVKKAAAEVSTKFCEGISKHAVKMAIPVLLDLAENQTKWQIKELSLKLLEELVDVAPEFFVRSLPLVVPVCSTLMWSTKKQVKKAATVTLEAACEAINNKDLEPFVPELIATILNPSEVEECVHKLAATTFVQTVEAGTLALTVPLLERGFKDRKTALKRKCAVITENMAKLVIEPAAAKPFLPVLIPQLEKAYDEVADDECRGVCKRVLEQLQRIQAKCDESKDTTDISKTVAKEVKKAPKLTSNYIGELCESMIVNLKFSEKEFESTFVPIMLGFTTEDDAKKQSKNIYQSAKKFMNFDLMSAEAIEEMDDDSEELCKCDFSLAYGSRILLNNAKLHLKRGKRYGIIAAKSAGKTTLLKSIANYQIDGFPTPDQLKTVFVDTDVQGFKKQQNVAEYCQATVGEEGIGLQECVDMLISVGFSEGPGVACVHQPITALSGGWRMKLALARAMLRKADILLMDEPTNHLDVLNVQWVEDYLTSEACQNVTSLIVSHDTKFLDNVATHIIHMVDLKLETIPGNMSSFVEKYPKAKSYFDLSASTLEFKFPEPGPLQGVRSKGKPILSMQNVTFTYPGAEKPQLIDINVRASMASRVACVGANGAGKSTMIKLLTGELEPSEGKVIKNPNLRFAYVAQHAFHHIEQHLNKTPNEYIRWRYSGGEDKEALVKSTARITEAEKKVMAKPIEVQWEDEETGKKMKEKRVIEKIVSRRKEGKKLVYEVKWVAKSQDLNAWYDREWLIERGFQKLLDELDRRLAAAEGAYARTLSQRNVEKHLENVGLERELGTHNRISSLSGGQKVKVVLGACTWNQPHLIILDEPTNYLDREALGALAKAIKNFGGGVVLITHNKEFADHTTRETWVVANNRCDIKGDAEWEKYAAEALELKQASEMTDASGNKIEIERKPESVKRKEKKKMTKEIKKKINNDIELSKFEEACADAWELWG